MEHSTLTGAALHEPKGVETASSGQVYVANGTGSGVWTDRLLGIANLNVFSLSGRLADISAPSSLFLVVPIKGQLTLLSGVLDGTITTAPAVLTVYKNGIAQTPTVSVSNTGSGAGVKTTGAFAVEYLEGDILEVRSNGASDTSAGFNISLKFTALA